MAKEGGRRARTRVPPRQVRRAAQNRVQTRGGISAHALHLASYTTYDPKKVNDDPHCVGFFQKEVGDVLLNVSLWRFPGERKLQVNFELLAPDRELALDIGLRGVPNSWTVSALEAYVIALLGRVRRPRAQRRR